MPRESPFKLRGNAPEEEKNISPAEKQTEAGPLKTLEEDERVVESFNFFLNRITNNSIATEGELLARFNAKFDNQGYLLDDNGRDVQGRDGAVREFNAASRQFKIEDGGQRDLLTRIYKFTNDKKVPEEVRSNLTAYFTQGDQQSFGRLKVILETGENQPLKASVEEIVEQYRKLKKGLDLKNSFYETLAQPDSFGACGALLGAYEEEDSEDRVLVANLRSKAFAKRRAEVLQKFGQSLANPAENKDIPLSLLETLVKSPSGEDKKAAVIAASALYRLELADLKKGARDLVKEDANLDALRQFVENFPTRPSLGDFDYVQTKGEVKEKAIEEVTAILAVQRLKKANKIRRSFPASNVDDVLQSIQNVSADTAEELAMQAQLIDLYRNYLAANNPGSFDERFAKELFQKAEKKLQEKFIRPEMGKNREALGYMRERFVETIYPLIESLKDDPRTKETAIRLLEVMEKEGEIINPRLGYIIRAKELLKQRPLTDIEKTYLQSVELLSVFNPYLVAAASADIGVTGEFLRHHFETRSQETLAGLKDGDYVPLIQIGTGPNGLVALGEVVRNNPALARRMLTVDSGEQPGGPFAIPRGPAWELNSANRRGSTRVILPSAPGSNEVKTVRAYGSPGRWYPGERSDQNRDVRQGSINVTVDYLLAPDDLSTLRYPTNEELQEVLALQASVLVNRIALRTRVLRVESNPNPEDQGDKIVTLHIDEGDGNTRQLRLKTDALFVSTGLGDPTYGFELKGSRAERVLTQTKDMEGFPKLSTTLEAFQAFADRTEKKRSPGQTLLLWGKGNSANTLIEFIGNIFQGDNPLVRDITKVYIVSDGDLSQRPRYSLISDLKPRNGKGNLIEFVRSRVSDIDFASTQGDMAERKVVGYGADGTVIMDAEGKPILADSAIAATGFRPQLDTIFKSYLTGGGSFRKEDENSPIRPLTLPTNENIAVADTLKSDPNVIFLGTASRPRFDSTEKLLQLPKEAREALLRNGAENAVAIGFRGPDTQAAVNIFFGSREKVGFEEGAKEKKTPTMVEIDGKVAIGGLETVDLFVSPEKLKVANNIAVESSLLSPLLSYIIGNRIETRVKNSGKLFSGGVNFDLSFNEAKRFFFLKFQGLTFSDPRRSGIE